MQNLHLQLFGRPEITVEGRPLRITCSHKVYELLGLLATSPHQRRARDDAAAVLWPDLRPQDGRAALRRHLHHLNSALKPYGESAVHVDGSWLVLADDIDVDIRTADDALAGDAPFLDNHDADWIPPVRVTLQERSVAALERHVAAAERSGDTDAALKAARRLERLDPFREDNGVRIARLLASSGDRLGALQHCDDVERRVREHFGTAPSANLTALRETLLVEPVGSRHGFPAETTRFVGRERESRELLAMLQQRRLVCCVGPPGVGKTRLACRVGADFARERGLPAFFVDVADSRTHDDVAGALNAMARREFMHHALGDRPMDTLRQSEALVLFDNAERVLEPLRQIVAELLKDGPRLHVVVTSRVPLHLDGEALCHVAPLPLEPAAELFVDRAQLVQPAARGTSRTAATIRALCERVDGIPLAIELVAAQLRTLTLFQLAAAPAKGSSTLRSTFDASLDLLDDDTRRLFRNLAVFCGGFSAESAAAVDRAECEPTEDRLATLVDHSLLTFQTSETQAARYTMLVPLREYALSLLQGSGESDALRERHARLYAERYVALTKQLNTTGAESYVAQIDAEHENIARALHALAGARVDVALAGRLCLALQHLWFVTGRVIEGSRWVAECLSDPQLDLELRSGLLFMHALMARHQTNYGVAIERYREVIAVRRAQHDEAKVAGALLHLSGCLSAIGDVAGALEAAREAERFFDRHPEPYFCGYVAFALGLAALRDSDVAAAESEFRKSLRHFQAADLELDVASTLSNLGSCALARGDFDAAVELSSEAVERAQKTSAPFIAAASRVTMALVACHDGDRATARRHARDALEVAIATNDHERLAELLEVGFRIAVLDEAGETGARLYGCAQGVRERCKAVRMPIDEAALTSWVDRCRERLGSSRFEALCLSGESLRTSDCVDALRRLIAGP